MTFILLLTLFSNKPIAMEFDSEIACKNAIVQIEKEYGVSRAICIPKKVY
jgi:hypothetical protein